LKGTAEEKRGDGEEVARHPEMEDEDIELDLERL